MELVRSYAWEIAAIGYVVLGVIILYMHFKITNLNRLFKSSEALKRHWETFFKYASERANDRLIQLFKLGDDLRLANGHVKYYKSQYEQLKKKQQPRDKTGKFIRVKK